MSATAPVVRPRNNGQRRRGAKCKPPPPQHRLLSMQQSALHPNEVWGVGFAGIGGWCTGFTRAVGIPPFFAVNHDAYAISIHKANHPETKHYPEDIFGVDIRAALHGLRLGWLHLSPDCRDFSRAKGGKPVSKEIRGLAWVTKKWAAQALPRIISLENVPEITGWGPLIAKRDKATGRVWKVDASIACPKCGQDVTSKDRCKGKVQSCGWRRPITPAEPGERIPVSQQLLVRDPKRRGEYFRQLVRDLEVLGYIVEHKQLCARDYGAPTSRKRLFLLARRDGQAINWPAPTHAKPDDARVKLGKLLRFKTTAECIDWIKADGSPNLGRSIFDRKKPHADATSRRVAQGFKRYVLDRRPFIVNLTHGGRLESIDEPSATITGAHRGEKAIVTPVMMANNSNNAPHGVEEPLGTVTTGSRHFAVSPILAKTHRNGSDGEAAGVTPCDEPARTLLAKDGLGVFSTVLAPIIARTAHGEAGKSGSKRWGNGSHPIDEALPTVTGSNDYAAISPVLIQTGYGERKGQAPRALDIQAPLGTVVAEGQKHALVGAFLAKHYGGPRRKPEHAGKSVDEPIGTITTSDHHSLLAASLIQQNYGSSQWQGPEEPLNTMTQSNHHAVVSAGLAKLRGTSTSADIDDPAPTITGQGNHLGLVTAQIVEYYGSDKHGCAINEPLPTVTTKDRFALVVEFLERFIPGLHFPDGVVRVEIDGAIYVVVDIFMRMLSPRELARCQGFDDSYILFGTITQQVGGVGNSVPPHFAEALGRANT